MRAQRSITILLFASIFSFSAKATEISSFIPSLDGRTIPFKATLFQLCEDLLVDRLLPSDQVRRIKNLIGDLNGLELGSPANEMFLAGRNHLPTGSGYATASVDAAQVPYPVRKRIVEAFIASAGIEPSLLKRLREEQFYVLDRVRSFLLEHPEKFAELKTAAGSVEFLNDYEVFVFFGPLTIERFDPQRDLRRPIPNSRQNPIIGARVFEDAFEAPQHDEYQGDGRIGYSKMPTFEGREIRILFSEQKKEIGYVDGIYVNAAAPGSVRGAFYLDIRKCGTKLLGHIIRINQASGSPRYVLIPADAPMEFFLKR